jgi:hypothetical protein
MNNAENVLEVLIKIGLLTPENAETARAAIAGVGKESAGAGEKVEGFNIHGRELSRIAGMMDRIVPGAGAAIRAFGQQNSEASMALIGIGGVLMVVIDLFKKVQAGAKAADDATAALLSEGGSKGAIAAVSKAWEDAHIASAVYHHKLFQDEDDIVKRIADTNIEIAKRFQTAQEQIDQAQKGVAVASIEALEKQAVISHEEALKRKYELDVEYENKKLALTHQTDARVLEVQRGELATKTGQKGAADINEAAAEAANKTAQGNLAKHEELVKTYSDNITKAKDAMKGLGIGPENIQHLNEAFEKFNPGKSSVTTPLSDQYMALLGTGDATTKGMMAFFAMHGGAGGLAAADTGMKDIKSNQTQLDAENKRDEALRTIAENAKSDLEETKRVQHELKKAIDDLTIKVGELAATNKANETNAATVAGLTNQAEAIKAGLAPPVSAKTPPPGASTTQAPFLPTGTSAAPDSAATSRAIDAEARSDVALLQQYAALVHAGGQLDTHQNAIMQHMVSMIVGHKATAAEISQVLTEVISSNREILTAFEAFRRGLQEVRERTSALERGH